MQADVYVNDPNTRARVNPATQESLVDLLNETKESTAKNSLTFGTQLITLSAVAVTAGNQLCRTALVSHSNSNATYVENAGTKDADALSFLIPPNVILEIPVRNTNKLSFFGAAADEVSIIWRD